MTVYRVPGDVLFSLFTDGTFSASTSGTSDMHAIGTEELAVLAVARSAGPAGTTEQGLIDRLGATGLEGDWKKAIGNLAKQRLIVPAGELPAEDRASAAVFGVGAGGSGGGILRKLLNSHPRLHCPMLNALPFMLGELLEEPDPMADLKALHLGQDWNRTAIEKLASSLISQAARKAGKTRGVQFFAPGHSSGLIRLDELYSGSALFLFPVRHALDFIDEAYRESRLDYEEIMEEGVPLGMLFTDALRDKGGVSHESLAEYWVAANREALSLKARAPERVHMVRYEELVSDTDTVFSQVLSFLGEARSGSVSKPAPPMTGMWKSWSPSLVRRIAQLVNPTMKELGYALVEF